MKPDIFPRNLILSAIVSTFFAPILLTPLTIHAQVLEEIVVSAQRRDQSIQEVPISLEAYTGDVLKQTRLPYHGRPV